MTNLTSSIDYFFNPGNVVLIGATDREGSVGKTILTNLMGAGFSGNVFPVNPSRDFVMGLKAYPSIARIPQKPDLAVIATPRETVPEIVKQCEASGVKAVIVITAGFKETGEKGIQLERSILTRIGKGRMRLIGPNCLGVMNPRAGLNATFANRTALPGNVAFISQSGALCTAILDWSIREKFGFSAFVSLGSMLDVGWGDLIDYLGSDPHTKSIVMYMESIGDARAFLSAAREVALSKPIIVLKAGRSEAGAKAASSHTGALVGSDAVYDAAFFRSGVLRVNRIAELFYMADVLSKQPRPRGPRLAIITNAGGAGVLAADSLTAEGGQLAEISPKTLQDLNAVLPSHWSHGNPVDILGDATPDAYAQTTEAVITDPAVDGLLVILTPQAMTNPLATAKKISRISAGKPKPVIASWMGAYDVAKGRKALNDGGIPVFEYPDTAASVYQLMWKYSDNLQSLYETPKTLWEPSTVPDKLSVTKMIESAKREDRTLLNEYESKKILEAYGIPAVRTEVARSAEEAAELARRIGFPVVLKLFSATITHKAEVSGVRLNLTGEASVRAAYADIEKKVGEISGPGNFSGVTVQPYAKERGYEVILGRAVDRQFGPILLFGAGGSLVEVMNDKAIGLPPLNSTLARRLIERTQIFKALCGSKNRKPADLARLEEILVLFSHLVAGEPRIREIDINPLLVSENGAIALDARVILYDHAVPSADLPKPAIRPYPGHYLSELKLQNGVHVLLRPIRPEDEPRMVAFHKTLSDKTVAQRYFYPLKFEQRTAHERLSRVCFNDYDREIALVAELSAGAQGRPIIAVGRLSRISGTDDAEFAILIADEYQNLGLGTALLGRLLEIAKEEGIRCLRAAMLHENIAMREIARKFHFRLSREQGESCLFAERKLSEQPHEIH